MIENRTLSREVIDHNPFVQFDIWFKEHNASATGITDSVSLGTSSPDGSVSVRTVLLKGFNETGYVFFTNYNSKKGAHLVSNPRAALLFHWPESARQVRIEGLAKKISSDESDLYFKTRPRESQLSAWASKQSSVIPDRQNLEEQYSFYDKKFSNKPVDKPPHWGGFRIIPYWFEFWQEGEFRLHDRLTYTKRKNIWIIERLAP
jgi:pyridoxamine 5'-phosphate oxidase